jgi:hypothetical protein
VAFGRRATEFLLQKFTVAVHLGNADCILGTASIEELYSTLRDCNNFFYLGLVNALTGTVKFARTFVLHSEP